MPCLVRDKRVRQDSCHLPDLFESSASTALRSAYLRVIPRSSSLMAGWLVGVGKPDVYVPPYCGRSAGGWSSCGSPSSRAK